MRLRTGFEIAAPERRANVKIAVRVTILGFGALPNRRKNKKNIALCKFVDWLMDCILP
jgi:hypothetical protein